MPMYAVTAVFYLETKDAESAKELVKDHMVLESIMYPNSGEYFQVVEVEEINE